jgi:hypothetical protein
MESPTRESGIVVDDHAGIAPEPRFAGPDGTAFVHCLAFHEALLDWLDELQLAVGGDAVPVVDDDVARAPPSHQTCSEPLTGYVVRAASKCAQSAEIDCAPQQWSRLITKRHRRDRGNYQNAGAFLSVSSLAEMLS